MFSHLCDWQLKRAFIAGSLHGARPLEESFKYTEYRQYNMVEFMFSSSMFYCPPRVKK